MKDFIDIIGNIDFQSVTLRQGEYYRQACLDKGNSKATVAKKLRHIKGLFERAVKREQLDKNPFQYISIPKPPKKKIRIYTESEYKRMLRAARDFISERDKNITIKWDLLILVCLETGMRRGELLNCCWNDIDFDLNQIDITAKDNTEDTWEWQIKDSEERTVPLCQHTAQLLIDLQSDRPTGYSYVFVPTARYEFIQTQRRAKGKWSLSSSRLEVVNSFYKQFHVILERANIKKKGNFHDIRRTALSNWLANGLTEYDVMTLAGHSNFQTTHDFYLAIKKDHLDKARQANVGLGLKMVDWE